MYKLVVILFISSSTISFCQDGDYIVRLDGEKIQCELGKSTRLKLKATVDSHREKYSPDEILGYKRGEHVFVSGKVVMNSSNIREWNYLELIHKDELSLYKVGILRNMIAFNPDGIDRFTEEHFFVGFSSTTMEELTDLGRYTWKEDLLEFGPECSPFIEKIDAANERLYRKEYLIVECIKVYNSSCEEE